VTLGSWVGEGVPSHGRGDAVTRWSHAAMHQRASQTRANAVRSIVSATRELFEQSAHGYSRGTTRQNTVPIYDDRHTPYASDVTGTCPVDYRSESLEIGGATWVLRLTPGMTRGNDALCAW
jgi:hypothetical protein